MPGGESGTLYMDTMEPLKSSVRMTHVKWGLTGTD